MLLKIVLFSVFLLLMPIVTPALAPPPSSHDEIKAARFIRFGCRVTLFPDLCVSSLSRHADNVGHSPVQLACVAANVALVRARTIHKRVKAALPRTDERQREVMEDCVEFLGDAADLVKHSIKELVGLNEEKNQKEVDGRISNAQKWLTAAMTDGYTCCEGFEEMGVDGEAVAEEVRGWVETATRYTSNALALVNILDGGRR